MKPTTVPYLKILNTQLMTTLRPQEAGLARMVAHYGDQTLSTLIVELELMPELQQAALRRYLDLLPDIVKLLANAGGDATPVSELKQALADVDYPRSMGALRKLVPLLSTGTDPSAMSITAKIAVIELDIQQAKHAAVARINTPPAQSGDADETLSVEQLRRLQHYLRATFPEEIQLTIGAVRLIPGGLSKQTIFVDLRDSKTLPAKIVLRVDKANSPVQSTVVDEFLLIKAMFEAGVPVPEPFAVSADTNIIGSPFLALSRIEGRNIGDALDVMDPSREFGLSLARNLAKMHQVAPEKIAHPLPGASGTVRERMLHEIAEFDAKWRATKYPSLVMELAFAWLKENIAYAEGTQRAIIHRDVGCHNMLVYNDELSALLDWETAGIGNSAQDLGYAYHTIVAMLPWEDFLAEYARAGGQVPRQVEVDYYRLWRAAWLVTLNSMARSYIEAGLTSDAGLAYAGTYALQRTEHTLHEVMDHVLTHY